VSREILCAQKLKCMYEFKGVTSLGSTRILG